MLRKFWVFGGLRNAQLVVAPSEEAARAAFLSPASRLKPQLELFAENVIEVGR